MFWIELSFRYGRTVAELQEEISSAHFVELMAAETLDPRGEHRADLRAGIMASVVANSAPFRSKTAKAYAPSDFMPKFGAPAKKKSKDIMATLRAWTESSGGTIRALERG